MASFDDVEHGGRRGRGDHLGRHHPRRARDDGPAGDADGRAVREGRLRPRRGRDPAVRIRRHGRRGRRRDRATWRPCSARRARSDSWSSQNETERLQYWAGRKNAFPAAGRVSPDYYCMDGTIPKKRLGEMLQGDPGDGGQVRAALPERVPCRRRQPASADPVRRERRRRAAPRRGRSAPRSSTLCVTLGGTITGEHGVGIEKINQMCIQFEAPELERFRGVKRAFDPKPACSIRTRASRRCIAAPNSVGCTCTAARCRTRTCRVSDGQSLAGNRRAIRDRTPGSPSTDSPD